MDTHIIIKWTQAINEPHGTVIGAAVGRIIQELKNNYKPYTWIEFQEPLDGNVISALLHYE